jgi:thiol-disulfide isomerase/thioredoxin
MVLGIENDNDFKASIEKNDKVIVKYFAAWCGSCRLFAPKFKRLAQDERFEGITFLDVNAEENPEARKMGNVKNLPTFAIFKNGELIEALASNKEDAVVDLMNKLN